MTAQHNYVASQLFFAFKLQLDPARFDVRLGMGHLRRLADTYYIPDVYVIPVELVGPLRRRPDVLEAYDAPLPLVVEVWSPSTGDYDVDTKLPEYQRRGDLEIWRIHPFERTLTAWRRQADGAYAEVHFTGGSVELSALPNISIDLAALFE